MFRPPGSDMSENCDCGVSFDFSRTLLTVRCKVPGGEDKEVEIKYE